MVSLNIRILVGYHKPARLLKDKCLTPIHLGRSVAKTASKDGIISEKDYQWLLNNMIGDNTGDNISDKNRYYNEMTGIYWAWKNYDKLDNPDYIGFMHYRRIFNLDFSDKKNEIYNKHELSNRLKNIDILCGNFWKHKGGIYQHYYDSEFYGHKIEFLDKALLIIKKLYPDSYNKINELVHQEDMGGFCNMFIMKRDIFFKYCEWIFPILNTLYEEMKDYKYQKHEIRNIGWVSERLTSIYFLLAKHNSLNLDEESIIALDQLIEQERLSKFKKFRYKILSKITFGKKRIKYKQKYKQLRMCEKCQRFQ